MEICDEILNMPEAEVVSRDAEKLAEIYEQYEMWEKAERIRKKAGEME